MKHQLEETISQKEGEAAESPRVVVNSDGSVFERESQDIAKQVEEADKIVSDYLDMRFDGAYRIDISRQHRTSMALLHVYKGNRGRMDFPTISVRKGNAAVIHETTHVIAPNYNRFLAEGLAVYIQDKFSQQSVPPTFGQDLHGGASESELKLEDLIKETRDYYYYWSRRMSQSQERRNAYLHAGSFVKFLIENKAYGADEKSRLERFKKLYALADNGEGRMFDIAYGKPLPEMEKEWRSYISGQKQRSEMLEPMLAINQKPVSARL
ncbi:hypothetical protein HYT53_00530 [Candidatus Woesearchaeota archaeon]|nr:hypothetical protein [Candidatus Woesearchaeota archaeon]